MDHDYQHLVYDISRREVLFMRDCPGEDHIVVLDYTKPGGVQFQVDSKDVIVPYAHLDVELSVQWDRLTRSGGRMEMHFMCLLEGLQFKPRVFPQLHEDSTEFNEGLTIAKSCPFELGTPAEKRHDTDSIRALVAKTRGRLTDSLAWTVNTYLVILSTAFRTGSGQCIAMGARAQFCGIGCALGKS
jgi:hypothetical protein